MDRKPYPCDWPHDWPRTPEDQRDHHARFEAVIFQDSRDLIHELELMGASNAVITSNLPTKSNGMPYASGRCDDPSIAVYWIDSDGIERVIACDRWLTPAHNLRAILLTVKAIRGINRWGASEIIKRAFKGFTALPEKASESSWRELLGEGNDLNVIKQRYRELLKSAHPDHGGTVEALSNLQAAMRAAEIELGGAQ